MNSEQRTMNDFGEMFNVQCSMFIFHWKVVDYPAFRLKEAQPMKLTAIRSLVAILAVFAIMPVCANAQQDFSNVQIKTNKISRSEERRVGKECRSQRQKEHAKKTKY